MVFMHLTVDGVMQARGRADEDPRGGFRHGGWAAPATQARDTVVLGSGKLVRWLIGRDLVDRYRLLIHPLLAGAGRRLFAADGPRRALRLLDARTTRTGVVITTYGPDRPSGRPEANPR